MIDFMASNWWMVLIRGLAAILFGVLAIAWPEITLIVLILLFAAHALVDGVAALAVGLSMRRLTTESPWAFLVIIGAISVVAGILAFLWPGLTARAFLLMIAVWAMSRGVFEIITAIQFRRLIRNEWFLILAGCLSILFGLLLIVWPAAGLMSLMWLVGMFAIAFGTLVCLLSLRLRKLERLSTAFWEPSIQSQL